MAYNTLQASVLHLGFTVDQLLPLATGFRGLHQSDVKASEHSFRDLIDFIGDATWHGLHGAPDAMPFHLPGDAGKLNLREVRKNRSWPWWPCVKGLLNRPPTGLPIRPS